LKRRVRLSVLTKKAFQAGVSKDLKAGVSKDLIRKFKVTVFAENKQEARSRIENGYIKNEEFDTYEESVPTDGNLKIDFIKEIKQIKQTTLKR